jgi:hypothetical protein
MDSEGELTKTTISSTNSALLTYTLSAQETAAVDGTGWFYINITPMNTAGVFWSFDPQGLPGMDPSWKQEENLYQNGTSAIINFNDTVKFSGKQTIYIFLDDEAMNGDATAFGETITGN